MDLPVMKIMNLNIRLRLVSIIAATALVTLGSGWLAAAPPKALPSIALTGADGTTVQLATYKGKVLVVDFWASWCIPCKTSFPALDAIYQEYQPRGLDVLAVNLDERRRDADTFLGNHSHHMTVLFDPKGVSPEAFGVQGMPSSFLIDKAGNIRFTHMGYSGNDVESYRNEITQLLKER
jgi:thiol-disulfide isomerase/thioredoxin